MTFGWSEEPNEHWAGVAADALCPDGCTHTIARHNAPEPGDRYEARMLRRWLPEWACEDCAECRAKLLPRGWESHRWKCGNCGEPIDLREIAITKGWPQGGCGIESKCCGAAPVDPRDGKEADEEVMDAI